MSLAEVSLGAAAALLATSAGSIALFAFRKVGRTAYSAMLASCAGVMAYSAMEMLGQSHATAGDAAVVAGLALGMLALFAADRLLPHAHAKIRGREIAVSKKKAALIAGAVTLHNVPEGLAIASAFAGSAPLGWLVALSIALQDIPEGFMISAPLAFYGVAKGRSVWFGILSGIVEAAAAIAGYLFLSMVSGAVPGALAFSAGAMAYVIFAELLPDAFGDRMEGVAALSFAGGAALAFGIASLLGF